MSELTYERAAELLEYNPETGELTWKVKTKNGKFHPGDVAGWLSRDNRLKNKSGYIRIGVDGTSYMAHRLAWLLVHGSWPEELDHVDGDKLNNRLENLREVSHIENMRNQRRRINSQKDGHLGVRWDTQRDLWKADIGHKGKSIVLGHFDKKEDAIKARKDAEEKYWGAA